MHPLTTQSGDFHGLIRHALGQYGVEISPVGDPDAGADLFALIPGCGSEPLKVPVELKFRSQPLGVAEADRWAHRRVGPVILAQPSVPRGRGSQYRALGINFIDSGGNAYLNFPGFQVHVEGRKPRLEAGPARRIASASTTPAGLKVIFAVLIRPDAVEMSYETLAVLAGTSKGSVTNAITDLRRRGHVAELAGKRRLIDPDRLARDWIDGYVRDLAPRLQELELAGPAADWWIQDWHEPEGTLSGGVALAAMGGDIRPDRTVVYGQPPWYAIRQGARLSRDGEAPVILRERFWSPDLLDDRVVPPLLAYADALTSGDPREAEVAQDLARRQEWAFRR